MSWPTAERMTSPSPALIGRDLGCWKGWFRDRVHLVLTRGLSTAERQVRSLYENFSLRGRVAGSCKHPEAGSHGCCASSHHQAAFGYIVAAAFRWYSRQY